MEVPEWVVAPVAVGSFVAGLGAQTIVRVKLAANGNGILREWGMGSIAFLLTVAAVWAVYFAVGAIAT